MKWTPILYTLLPCAFAVSCATQTARIITPRTSCAAAESTLMQDWRMWNELRQTPGGCDRNPGLTCDMLQAKIERLAMDCPGNASVMMANALLAWKSHNPARAQQLLDELSSQGSINPDAAALRARIAMEQGNMPFALNFLEQQIHRTGDDAGLRETYASALYLTGQWQKSGEQLEIARRLGAPVWRISYGLGLVEEAQGHYAEAKARYEESLRGKPGWRPAESRLRGLSASGRIPGAN